MTDINKISLDFRKRLGSFHLDINCVLENKLTAFFGASGCGKSTLLNCISGIHSPDDGTITLDDHVLFDSGNRINIPVEKRGVGYVFQEGHLFPHLTVIQNIQYGVSRKAHKVEDSLHSLIELLEISDFLQRYPKQLSGGQRQHVAIARALAMKPRLLLMDEPLASLDTGLKNRIIPYLHHIKNTYSIPILYVTHAISEVMALADEAFLLSDGKITANGDPYQFLTAPSALPIANLTGVENILLLPITGSDKNKGITELKIGSQHIIIPYIETNIGKEVPIAIRAEDVIISLEENLPISARNILKGKINAVDQHTLISIHLEGHHLTVKITQEAQEQLQLSVGKEVFCVIKANAINLLWHES